MTTWRKVARVGRGRETAQKNKFKLTVYAPIWAALDELVVVVFATSSLSTHCDTQHNLCNVHILVWYGSMYALLT